MCQGVVAGFSGASYGSDSGIGRAGDTGRGAVACAGAELAAVATLALEPADDDEGAGVDDTTFGELGARSAGAGSPDGPCSASPVGGPGPGTLRVSGAPWDVPWSRTANSKPPIASAATEAATPIPVSLRCAVEVWRCVDAAKMLDELTSLGATGLFAKVVASAIVPRPSTRVTVAGRARRGTVSVWSCGCGSAVRASASMAGGLRTEAAVLLETRMCPPEWLTG